MHQQPGFTRLANILFGQYAASICRSAMLYLTHWVGYGVAGGVQPSRVTLRRGVGLDVFPLLGSNSDQNQYD